MEKTYRINPDDRITKEIAVIIYNNYGGWYTNGVFYGNPDLIDLLLENEINVDMILINFKTNFPDIVISDTDVKNLAVEWIPVGTKFRICEYDGLESVEYYDMDDWEIA